VKIVQFHSPVLYGSMNVTQDKPELSTRKIKELENKRL
jgi:hypothetical protein